MPPWPVTPWFLPAVIRSRGYDRFATAAAIRTFPRNPGRRVNRGRLPGYPVAAQWRSSRSAEPAPSPSFRTRQESMDVLPPHDRPAPRPRHAVDPATDPATEPPPAEQHPPHTAREHDAGRLATLIAVSIALVSV